MISSAAATPPVTINHARLDAAVGSATGNSPCSGVATGAGTDRAPSNTAAASLHATAEAGATGVAWTTGTISSGLDLTTGVAWTTGAPAGSGRVTGIAKANLCLASASTISV